MFTAPADVLHPGEGARVLEYIVGSRSVLLLDGREHLSQRKLMLPAFHGERMRALVGVMEEVAEREVDGWRPHEAFALHTRTQALTLEIILRAVFGLAAGPQLDELRVHAQAAARPRRLAADAAAAVPPPPRPVDHVGALRRRARARRRADPRPRRRAPPRGRGDRGRALDAARRPRRGRAADDRPRAARRARDAARRRPRDDGVGALVGLRAARARAGGARARDAGRGSPSEEAYLEATVKEILRRRPVLPIARAAADQAADRDRRPRRIRRGRRSPPASTSSITTRGSTPTRTRSAPSASSTARPGPTAGSRSAAACAAASAPRSPSSRCGSRCARSSPRSRSHPRCRAARASAGARSRSARAAARRSRCARACASRRSHSAPDSQRASFAPSRRCGDQPCAPTCPRGCGRLR